METNTGGTECLQHNIPDTGTFTGEQLGYATLAVTNSGSTVNFCSLLPGTIGNGFTVSLVDPRPVPCPVTTARMTSETDLQVMLKTNAGGTSITATAADVAAAVRAIRKRCPIVAATSDTGVMAAASTTNLAGGVDPDTGPILSFTGTGGPNGGLFYFDQYLGLRVMQIEGVFSGSGTVAVNIVQVDSALNVVSGTAVTIYKAALSALHDFCLTDKNIVVLPGMALQVVAPLQGLVRVYFRREGGLG